MTSTLKMDRLVALRLPKADHALIREIANREEMKTSEVYRQAIREFLAEERLAQKFTKLLGELDGQGAEPRNSQ